MTIFDELKAGLVSESAEQTEAIGRRLAEALPADSALALSGDLGTGKTTLVRGIARGLGVTQAVTSPTYTIYTIYTGRRQLLHMDAYRLSGSHQIEDLAVEEFLQSPWLIALEWPENVPDFLQEYSTTSLRLRLLPDHRHMIEMA